MACSASLLLSTAALADGPPPLYCDNTIYAPLQLSWSQDPNLKQVNGVFPHPLLTARVVATTGIGLWLSDDAGRTWKELPEAGVEKVGVIQKIAFNPTQTDTFYLASQTKGIWVTTDAGKSFQQVGTKANGMASDTVEDIIVYPVDPFHKTLLAVHGTSAPGISHSRDGGKTWDVLTDGYFFQKILARERESKAVFLVGSTKGEPDVRNLYVCSSLGELAFELMHDAMITDLAFSIGRSNTLYVSTSDTGLYRLDTSQFSPEGKPLGSKDDGWTCVSTTWGPNADVQTLCLFNPARGGLVLSSNELATTRTYAGLPTGALVKEGASVRPNANGTIYYAAINETLMVARPDEKVPVVNVTPAAFEPVRDSREATESLVRAFDDFLHQTNSIAKAAKDLCQKCGDPAALYHQNQITVTARLPLKPAPPVSVTADLSRFGGSSATPMLDDGLHCDGAAGDGLYGFTFYYDPGRYNDRGEDWRAYLPGRMAIGVSASFKNGTHQGAVGIVGVYPKIQSMILAGYYQGFIGFSVEGDVKADAVPNPKELHTQPTTALRIQPGHGPWSVALDTPPWHGGDITGYEAFSFGIRVADGTPPKEMYVQLRDTPDLSAATTTDRVGVTHDFVREGSINSDYRTVVVPFNKLLGKQISQFQTSKLSKIIISGDGGDPVTLLIDWPSYLAPSDGSAPTTQAPPK